MQIIPASIYPGLPFEEKPLPSCRLNEFEQTQIKLKAPEVEFSAKALAVTWTGFELTANNREPLGALANGIPSPEADKASDKNLSVEECGEQIVPLPKHLLNYCLNIANPLT